MVGEKKQESEQEKPTNTPNSPPPKPFARFSSNLPLKKKQLRAFDKMDLHDATGTILPDYSTVNDQTAAATAAVAAQHVQTGQPSHQHHQAAQSAKQEPKQEVVTIPHHPNHSSAMKVSLGSSSHQPGTSAQSGPMASLINTAPVPTTMQTPVRKKPTRMPGTKQCPSCGATIAAAVAKCPKCHHVFREKKEKIKRSGKRGKKNCPKCGYENPSACSQCKRCKYVFRLKLIDKYKAMRPRQTSDQAAAEAAAAAHAAANIGQGANGEGVQAVSTVPVHPGVATFPNPIAHPLHSHSIPPLQHPIALSQQHSVHSTSMPLNMPSALSSNMSVNMSSTVGQSSLGLPSTVAQGSLGMSANMASNMGTPMTASLPPNVQMPSNIQPSMTHSMQHNVQHGMTTSVPQMHQMQQSGMHPHQTHPNL